MPWFKAAPTASVGAPDSIVAATAASVVAYVVESREMSIAALTVANAAQPDVVSFVASAIASISEPTAATAPPTAPTSAYIAAHVISSLRLTPAL